MRSLYLCTNCKQYHGGCSDKKYTTTNSIQYLRLVILL